MRLLAVICSLATLTLATPLAANAKTTPGWDRGIAQPKLIARVSRQVFGTRAATAECIAHYESTDGAHLYNGTSLGPWQVDVQAHPWVSARRIVRDWLYAAKVAYRISRHGTDWSAWGTHTLCGV